MKKGWNKWSRRAGCLLMIASLFVTESGMVHAMGNAETEEKAETSDLSETGESAELVEEIEEVETAEKSETVETFEEPETTESEEQDVNKKEDAVIIDQGNELESIEGTKELGYSEELDTAQSEMTVQVENDVMQYATVQATESSAYKPYKDAAYELTYRVNENGVIITGYTGTAKGELVIPESIEGVSVTGIGSAAFENCYNLTGNLVIPDSVVIIGGSAFYGCSGFTGSLVIPDSVVSIGRSAFMKCSGFMGTLELGNSVADIGAEAFRYCDRLTGSLTIPNSVDSIGYYAFNGCKGLSRDIYFTDKEIDMPADAFFLWETISIDTVTYIEHNAEARKSVVFHAPQNSYAESFACKEGYSYQNINEKEKVYKPYTNASYELRYQIEEDGIAITGCKGSAEEELVIPDTIEGLPVVSIESGSFYLYRNFTGDLIIPDGVTRIGDYAFHLCDGLSGNLKLSNNLTSIGEYAFYGCDKFVGSLKIPDGVTEIKDYTFYWCSGFEGGLKLPDNVTSIGNKAFANCRNLTGKLVIPKRVVSIKDYAFYWCGGFSGDLEIPDSVTEIGSYALCCGITLPSIKIPAGVSNIGSNALGYYLPYSIVSQYPVNKNMDFVIYGYTGSAAEAYAIKEGFTFIPYKTMVADDKISIDYTDETVSEMNFVARHLVPTDPEYAEIDIAGNVLNSATNPDSINFEAYDIALVSSNGQHVQPAENVKVSIPCPEGYSVMDSKVYRVNAKGSLTDMEASYSVGRLIFTTNHFGTYLITETELKTAPAVTYGDANSDGSVNSLDAVMIKRYLAGYEGLNMNETAADVNADGSVNSLDAVKILQSLAGYDVVLGEK